jgi:CHAT domain-containing protein
MVVAQQQESIGANKEVQAPVVDASSPPPVLIDDLVLSACYTPAAYGNSVEAVSGLGRGFFYAVARLSLQRIGR